MLFLLTAYLARVSGCKNTNNYWNGKIFLNFVVNLHLTNWLLAATDFITQGWKQTAGYCPATSLQRLFNDTSTIV